VAEAPPRVPGLFVVGAPKAATSSLHLFLRHHPGVFMCSPKEPHFFSTDLPGLAEVESRADYDALFAAAPEGALLGEASAFYLRSETAAANIRAANPEARIVLSIREPVSASVSWYHQLRDGFREDQPDFAASWDLQDARARGERLPPYCPEPAQLQYRAIYDYAPQIARYIEAFGRDRVRIFRFERIKAEPAAVAAELLDFLGLPPAGGAIGETNVRRRPLVPGVTQFLAAPPAPLRPLVAPAKRMLNALGLRPSELVMKHLTRPAGPGAASPAAIDAATRARIGAAFAPSIDRLEALLGEDFAAWQG
jgi:hypothetical protein